MNIKIILKFLILGSFFVTFTSYGRDFNNKEFDILEQQMQNQNQEKKEKFISAGLNLVKATYGLPVHKNHENFAFGDIFQGLFLDVEKEDALGAFMLGYVYESGLGVASNQEKALEYYNKAEKRGSIDAIYLLGLKKHSALTDFIYFKQKTRKEAIKRYKDSRKLFLKAADMGHDYAQIFVANMYINGELGDENYKNALKYINKAIKKNPGAGYAALGAMYLDRGQYKDSVKMLKKAVNNKSPIAAILLFNIYSCGVEGIASSQQKASKYKKLAYQNSKAIGANIEEINSIFDKPCIYQFGDNKQIAFTYSALDLVNDYIGRNRYFIGVIPDVFKKIALGAMKN